ncbi:MAG: sigma-54-dependent Fis family transcriptional regulator [Deltaproteobacteria bacterium]|nr:sigma-54-dependent Fis family transcriptional regulator [Deltaproteobacteria bacterium]
MTLKNKLNEGNNLLKYLINLCEDLSKGRYTKVEELFEHTKEAKYPPVVTRLAEAFGMMMVKVEAREFRLEQVIDDLKKTKIDLSIAKERLSSENIQLKQTLRGRFTPTKILGTTPQVVKLLEEVEKVADTPINILITGETGTGKELIAKTIHYNSSRSEKPFIPVNCSAIPEPIFESEMFGIEKGVATGVEKRIGKIEQANGGTLLLDEIGDMSLSSQAKLLRVIEDYQLERVGGRKAIPVDIRIIGSTNKDLNKEVKKGDFRKDLFYRLNVVNLHLPPLRERKDDISLLANYFLEQCINKFGRKKMIFSSEVVEKFKDYPWPGNVRELENEVERAVALSYSDTIMVDHLSENVREFSIEERPEEKPTSMKEAEILLVRNTLEEFKGNKTKAARILGLSREGLRKKMKRYRIK